MVIGEYLQFLSLPRFHVHKYVEKSRAYNKAKQFASAFGFRATRLAARGCLRRYTLLENYSNYVEKSYE